MRILMASCIARRNAHLRESCLPPNQLWESV